MLRADEPIAGATTTGDDDRLVLVFGNPEASHRPVREPVAQPPAGGQPEGLVEGRDFHVVAEGETLSSIADHYWGDPSLARELAELNGLEDPDDVKAGQTLRLR